MREKIKTLLNWLGVTIRGVRLRQFFTRPILFLIPLAILYLLVGIGFAIAWYGVRSDKPIVRRSLHFFPFPAAIVDGGMVWSSELSRQVGFVLQFSEKTGQSQIVAEQAPSKIFDRLIENKMIEKAAQRARVRVTVSQLDQAYQQVTSKHGGDEQVAKVLLNLYGMKPADFKRLIAAELIKQQVRDQLLLNLKIRHILLKDEKRAKELLEKLKVGAKFEDLAKEFSEDKESRDKGGELGFVRRGQLPDPLFNAASVLKPGELGAEPVKTDAGFHIIRVDDRRGSVDQTYEQWFDELKKKTRVIKFVKT